MVVVRKKKKSELLSMLARECLKWCIVDFDSDKEGKLYGDNDLRMRRAKWSVVNKY